MLVGTYRAHETTGWLETEPSIYVNEEIKLFIFARMLHIITTHFKGRFGLFFKVFKVQYFTSLHDIFCILCIFVREDIRYLYH